MSCGSQKFRFGLENSFPQCLCVPESSPGSQVALIIKIFFNGVPPPFSGAAGHLSDMNISFFVAQN